MEKEASAVYKDSNCLPTIVKSFDQAQKQLEEFCHFSSNQ